MEQNTFLLYGANGYTGELIARHAAEYGLVPIIAGRRKEAIEPLAKKLGLAFKIFDLNDKSAVKAAVAAVKTVVHAAGPYDFTAKPMVEACLQTGSHYIDLNGDKDVFEMLYSYDAAAKQSGIMLMPGAGFDVVPTDCMAMYLRNQLPDASHLKIAFATPGGSISHGTAITTIAKLGEPGAIRKDGRLVPVPIGHKAMWVNFFRGNNRVDKKIFVMTIPWGDIFTAYISTGIPNIETYTAVAPLAYPLVKMQVLFNWLLRKEKVRSFLKTKIDKRPAGLDDAKRKKAVSLVWVAATNKDGKKVIARTAGPDAYTLTAYSCLIITRHILNGMFKAGYQTPASAYGPDLVLEIPGVKRESL
jgi:short subunit dehydrogenase-like uncharacterized protein